MPHSAGRIESRPTVIARVVGRGGHQSAVPDPSNDDASASPDRADLRQLTSRCWGGRRPDVPRRVVQTRDATANRVGAARGLASEQEHLPASPDRSLDCRPDRTWGRRDPTPGRCHRIEGRTVGLRDSTNRSANLKHVLPVPHQNGVFSIA
jgi:hypothetical protein